MQTTLESNLTERQRLALDAYLGAVYARLLAEKRREDRPAGYNDALDAVRTSGAEINDHVMWLATSVDVLHTGRDEDFCYQGVLIRDEKEIELLIFTGDIAADYRSALLRCFGSVEPGTSVWQVVPRSGCLIVAHDEALGSVLAYKEGFGPASHRSEKAEAEL